MSDPETLAVYAAQSGKYAELTDSMTKVDPQLQRFIAGVPSGGRVLDLGCGPGASAGRMAAAGLVVDAWDPVPEMLDLARRFEGVTVRQAGFADLTVSDSYDGIWANFSMLHMPRADWPRLFKAISTALRTGGLFHIGTKLGTGEHRDGIGRMYTYVTEEELGELLRAEGMQPEYTDHGRDAGLSGELADWIVVQTRA